MLREHQPQTVNWDWILFKKLADVEEATDKFVQNIPEEFKDDFAKEPEETQFFIVLLSLLSNEERQQLKTDFKAGKARNHVLEGHALGNCLQLYDIFSGEALKNIAI